MIRQDYILRAIADFAQILNRLQNLKGEKEWSEATGLIDEEVRRLVDLGPEAIGQLSETELLARLIESQSELPVLTRAFMLTTLLHQAGDVAMESGRDEEGKIFYTSALHLLLDASSRAGVSDIPDFTPRVEALVRLLQGTPLSVRTQAFLMQHYETMGQWAKAEDSLYALLEDSPKDPNLIPFALAFYERLLQKSDESLGNGGLPRAEVEQGLAELQRRV